ncbi:MAG: hypothetical protein AABX38_06440 [Candidatus Micrarchaeota archaeon]
MAVLKANDVKKLSKDQIIAKIAEMHKLLLELEGEGKREKSGSVKQAIARLKTHYAELMSKEEAAKSKK